MLEWLVGLLSPGEWEALRNWLATAGGLVALFIALNTYRRNARIKREEQARFVYAKLRHFKDRPAGEHIGDLLPHGSLQAVLPAVSGKKKTKDAWGMTQKGWEAIVPAMEATMVVHNGSKELIGPVRLQLVDGDAVIHDYSARIETIDPESEYVVNFIVENIHAPGISVPQATIVFRDASGQWWRRHRAEPIEHVHKDPENEGPTPTERVRIRREQQSIGVPKEHWIAEPKLSLRVRWHRFWRKARGRSAIP